MAAGVRGMVMSVFTLPGFNTVFKIIKEVKKPNDDLKETVRKHEEWLVRDNDRIKSIESLVITQEGIKKELNEHSRRLGEHEERLEEDKQRGNLTLKANIAIINNMLSENDKDKLQETRDEIQNFLLDKN